LDRYSLLLKSKWELRTKRSIMALRLAYEKHEDGSPHIHYLIKFSERPYLRSTEKWINELHGKYGDIQRIPCRDFHKTAKYLVKGGEYFDIGEPSEFLPIDKPKKSSDA